MTRIIAISIFKGGQSKTTTAVNLSAALSLLDRRVLLVNTDTQAQCEYSLGVDPPGDLTDFVAGDKTAVYTARPNLDLLAGGPTLAGLKMELAKRPYGAEKALSEALAPIARRYDYIILDTGPGFDSLSIAALFAAHEIIAPVNLEALAVNGLVDFVNRLTDIQKHHDIQLSYVVPVAMDRRVGQTAEILEQLRASFDGLLCDPIRYNVRLSEAPAHGQHIFEYDGRSNGAADYAALCERILKDG